MKVVGVGRSVGAYRLVPERWTTSAYFRFRNFKIPGASVLCDPNGGIERSATAQGRPSNDSENLGASERCAGASFDPKDTPSKPKMRQRNQRCAGGYPGLPATPTALDDASAPI